MYVPNHTSSQPRSNIPTLPNSSTGLPNGAEASASPWNLRGTTQTTEHHTLGKPTSHAPIGIKTHRTATQSPRNPHTFQVSRKYGVRRGRKTSYRPWFRSYDILGWEVSLLNGVPFHNFFFQSTLLHTCQADVMDLM